jgi:hypothetical protein
LALVDKDNESQNARRGNYIIITEQNTDEQNIAAAVPAPVTKNDTMYRLCRLTLTA